MKDKKKYNAPSITTEKIEIGVFGNYGNENHGGFFGYSPWFRRRPRRRR